MSGPDTSPMVSAMHDSPATIELNHFKYKSLSSWALNLFMGCAHGCRFCYVTETSTNKQGSLLGSYGVKDPVKDWGSYVLVRPWDRAKFMASLRKAERTAAGKLKVDGNRAVFLCSTDRSLPDDPKPGCPETEAAQRARPADAQGRA